jgi:hypothetical protein
MLRFSYAPTAVAGAVAVAGVYGAKMAVRVKLKNERTGEIKLVKVGWSWTLFFFAGVWGIPLFMRRLYALGAIQVGISIIYYAYHYAIRSQASPLTATALSGDDAAQSALALLGYSNLIISLGIIVWLIVIAIKGNGWTAKNYLENGWVFLDPDSKDTAYAKGKWRLA